MKTTSPFLIIPVLLLAIAVPCPAQKYHDAQLNDARGSVKSLKTGTNTLYEYNADGQLTTIDDDNFLGHGVKYKRDAQGRITTLYLYLDKACSQFNCSIDYTYNDKGQIATKSEEIADENAVVRYTYNNMGYMTREALYVDGQLIRELSYEYDRFDHMNNWTSRWRYNSNLNYKDQETRTLTYWESTAPSGDSSPASGTGNADRTSLLENLIGKRVTPQSPASEGWQALIGKRLSLTTYGISQNEQEANRFECQTDEYIKLGSDGVLLWENRCDGNTSYRYRIDGKRIYLTQISGKETGDKWFELTRQSDSLIKTESNLGTYRYFHIDN